MAIFSIEDLPAHLPVAATCLRNQQAILDVLTGIFSDVHLVLEIGSGTGQHAVYCAAGLPHLRWQPTELEDSIGAIESWRDYAALSNINPPAILDVNSLPWTTVSGDFDGVFTANTLHFIGWPAVESLFAGLDRVTTVQSVMAIYGPFNENGCYTSEGNQALDVWLKQRDADSGIKDLSDIEALAHRHQWLLQRIHKMPANNLLLEFSKEPAE